MYESENGLEAKRYTARTSDGGRMIFSGYDEMERGAIDQKWRVKRAWRDGSGHAYLRDIGVTPVERPELRPSLKAKLLTEAKAQIVWAEEEQ